jgi:hypothetical protein
LFGLWIAVPVNLAPLYILSCELLTNRSRLILDNLGIVGFLVCSRMAVDSSHFSINFDVILSPKYFILKVLKRSFNPNVRTATGKRICRNGAVSFISKPNLLRTLT